MLFFIFLFLGGIGAGILGSVVGMASLISYPILLAAGLSPVVANITNTAALIFSGIGATASSRRELRYNTRDLRWILPIAMVGSITGCILLLAFPSQIFEKVAPFMIAAVAIYFALQPYLHKQKQPTHDRLKVPVARSLASICLIFIIGAYGGYFGAASGIFMLIVFSMTEGLSLLTANALKNVTMGVTNLIATLVFIFFAHIDWLAALTMGAGFLLGGFIGPRIARHLPRLFLRWLIIIGALILAASMFKTAFL